MRPTAKQKTWPEEVETEPMAEATMQPKPEDTAFEWVDPTPEVRVEAYGCNIVSTNGGYVVRMMLEDSFLFSQFLHEPTLALFLRADVEIRRKLDPTKFCSGALRIMQTENAGGSSELSEAFSFELLHRTLGVTLDKTEMELLYFTGTDLTSKITDYSMLLDDVAIGVSVTRACKGFPCPSGSFSLEEATRLLTKKLHGVNESTKHVINASWKKQLLHIFAPDVEVATVLEDAYGQLPLELRANTVVLVSVCTGPGARDIFVRNERSKAPVPKKKRSCIGFKPPEHLKHLEASDPVRNARIPL